MWYIWVWTLIALLGMPFLYDLTRRAYENWRTMPQDIVDPVFQKQYAMLAFARFRTRVIFLLILIIYFLIGMAVIVQVPQHGQIIIFGLIACEIMILAVIGVWDYIDARRFDRLGTTRRWWSRRH